MFKAIPTTWRGCHSLGLQPAYSIVMNLKIYTKYSSVEICCKYVILYIYIYIHEMGMICIMYMWLYVCNMCMQHVFEKMVPFSHGKKHKDQNDQILGYRFLFKRPQILNQLLNQLSSIIIHQSEIMLLIFSLAPSANIIWNHAIEGHLSQWIGLRENLNRKPMGFYHQIDWGFL